MTNDTKTAEQMYCERIKEYMAELEESQSNHRTAVERFQTCKGFLAGCITSACVVSGALIITWLKKH